VCSVWFPVGPEYAIDEATIAVFEVTIPKNEFPSIVASSCGVDGVPPPSDDDPPSSPDASSPGVVPLDDEESHARNAVAPPSIAPNIHNSRII
jgi:hypothetical protein